MPNPVASQYIYSVDHSLPKVVSTLGAYTTGAYTSGGYTTITSTPLSTFPNLPDTCLPTPDNVELVIINGVHQRHYLEDDTYERA